MRKSRRSHSPRDGRKTLEFFCFNKSRFSGDGRKDGQVQRSAGQAVKHEVVRRRGMRLAAGSVLWLIGWDGVIRKTPTVLRMLEMSSSRSTM
jgi:hypothetical protein